VSAAFCFFLVGQQAVGEQDLCPPLRVRVRFVGRAG
jgi:hypothetical protein